MKDAKTQIKKVVIEIAGKELLLTPTQAKELRDILCELYAKPVNEVVKHVHHDYRYHYPYATWTVSSGLVLCSNTTTASGYVNANCANSSASSDTVYLSAVA